MASGKDFLPNNDTELQAWLTNFVTILNANIGVVGLISTDITPLTTAQTNFNTAVTTQISTEAVFRSAAATKKTRRIQLETALRPLVRRINNHPGITRKRVPDGLRGNLKITVPDRVPTRKGVGPEIPGVVLEPSPGRVIVHFGTNAGNEQRNGKPDWAIGCNLYRKKGAETDYTLIAFAPPRCGNTASPYVDAITGAAVNVSYKAAYRGPRAADIGGSFPEQTGAAGG